MNKLLLISAGLLISLAGLASAAEDEKKQAPPTFKSGADVELQVTLKSPKKWKINHMMPLSFTFDEEYLKTAPFKAEEASQTIKLEQYASDLTVVIPVTLNKGLADGKLSIPIAVTFSICNEVTDFCAFSQETISVPVVIQAVADPEGKNQALTSGEVAHSHLLSVP